MPLLGPRALHTALARLPLNMGNTPWHPDTALRPANPPLPTPGQAHGSQWRPSVLVLAGGSQWPPGSLTSAQLAQCKVGVMHSEVGQVAELGFTPNASVEAMPIRQRHRGSASSDPIPCYQHRFRFWPCRRPAHLGARPDSGPGADVKVGPLFPPLHQALTSLRLLFISFLNYFQSCS